MNDKFYNKNSNINNLQNIRKRLLSPVSVFLVSFLVLSLCFYFFMAIDRDQSAEDSKVSNTRNKASDKNSKTANIRDKVSGANNKISATAEKASQRKIKTGTLKLMKSPEKEVNIIMNDPLMNKKWGLEKINTKETWRKFSKGSRKIIVAVIDTGIDINHPDLKRNIWKNPKEIPGNNIDDDKNGHVDDIHGWNFVKDNNKIYDTNGHGTHIAGIIGADGGNGIGISGVAPKVSLMALKYYNPNDNGENNLENTVKAIQYAVKNGAHIINYSGGGLEKNQLEKKAIQIAEEKGVLFVAAAGNEGSNADKVGYYPAGYKLSNILSITTSDKSHNEKPLKSSNTGKKVGGAAPGIDIFSTLPGGKYGYMTGTSQATAFASGAAVLIADYYKNNTARFIITQLKMTGDKKVALEGKTNQGRRLNIFRALAQRGIKVNFRDEIVDTSGKFISGEISLPEEPLSQLARDIEGIELMQENLDSEQQISDKKKNEESSVKEDDQKQRVPAGSLPENRRGNIEQKQGKRSPSSFFEDRKKVPFLKRWFFK